MEVCVPRSAVVYLLAGRKINDYTMKTSASQRSFFNMSLNLRDRCRA